MRYIIVLLLMSLMIPAMAQDLQELTEVGKSESEDLVQARQDIAQDAIERVSAKLIRELIGDGKFDRNFTTIKTRVISQSDKYVPFQKLGDVKKEGTVSRATVTVKVSIENLKSLLLQGGFLAASEGPAVILPAISFTDLIMSKSYRWWMDQEADGKSFLRTQAKKWQEQMKLVLTQDGYFILDPLAWEFRQQVPEGLRQESPRTQDWLQLGEQFKAEIVVKGDIRFEPGKNPQTTKISANLAAIHSGTGRVIADAVRSLETESGSFEVVVAKKMESLSQELIKDLTEQIKEAWKRGSIGAQLVRLSIKGRYEYKDIESIKDFLKKERQIRSVSERYFATDRVDFEVDVPGGGSALSAILQKNNRLKVSNADGQMVLASWGR